LQKKYIKADLILQVLQLKINLSCITGVAEALLNHETTLIYDQVRFVLKKNLARLQGK
jgi:hypothetical protein